MGLLRLKENPRKEKGHLFVDEFRRYGLSWGLDGWMDSFDINMELSYWVDRMFIRMNLKHIFEWTRTHSW